MGDDKSGWLRQKFAFNPSLSVSAQKQHLSHTHVHQHTGERGRESERSKTSLCGQS